MRFVVLVVGGVATGALSVGAVRSIVPQNSQMFQAVRALGSDMANFKLGDINPLKAYEDVKRQITSGNIAGSLNLGSPVSIPSFSSPNIGNLGLGNSLHIDNAEMSRAFAAGLNSQIQQNNRRMEDISAYARNPMAWHGAPPF